MLEIHGFYVEAEITVTYTNGSKKTAMVDESIDGFMVGITDDQWEKPWKRGATNNWYLVYKGHKAAGKVVIQENPVKSIELIASSPVFISKKQPVPYVFLTWPFLKQHCPNSAAC